MTELINGPWNVAAEIFVDDVDGRTVCTPMGNLSETRIASHDRYAIADALERDGEYTLSSKVRRDECFDRYDLSRVEDVLGRQGIHRHWDYSEQNCYCEEEE